MNFTSLGILLAVLLTLIIIFFLISLFIALWTIFALVKTKVPFAKTPEVSLSKIFKEIKLPPNSLIYDLGCGDGRILFYAEKLGYRAVGYELSLYPYLKCLLKKISKKSSIKIINKNFYQADFSDADAVFLFLVTGVMEKVGKKLKNDLKPDTKIISYGFTLPGWPITKILDTSPSKTYFYKT